MGLIHKMFRNHPKFDLTIITQICLYMRDVMLSTFTHQRPSLFINMSAGMDLSVRIDLILERAYT